MQKPLMKHICELLSLLLFIIKIMTNEETQALTKE